MRAVALMLLASFYWGSAGKAAAQTPPPQPAPTPAPAPQPAPTLPPPTVTPQPAPVAPAAPSATPPAPPPAPGPEAAPPPPTFPAPTDAPPPPRYEPLGKPEPEIEKGDWDPWEHATVDQHRHNGFFLRLAIGPSIGSVSGDQHIFRDVGDVEMGGFGLAASIAIGGALVDNVILNADLFQVTLFDPSVEATVVDEDGRRLEVRDDDVLSAELGLGDDVNIVGMGLGVTFYIMPINIYIGGSVGIGQVVFEDEDGDRDGSDAGFVGNVIAGKEWWVGEDWGIGIAAQFVGVLAEDEVLGDVGGVAGNVLFSATYN